MLMFPIRRRMQVPFFIFIYSNNQKSANKKNRFIYMNMGRNAYKHTENREEEKKKKTSRNV